MHLRLVTVAVGQPRKRVEEAEQTQSCGKNDCGHSGDPPSSPYFLCAVCCTDQHMERILSRLCIVAAPAGMLSDGRENEQRSNNVCAFSLFTGTVWLVLIEYAKNYHHTLHSTHYFHVPPFAL